MLLAMLISFFQPAKTNSEFRAILSPRIKYCPLTTRNTRGGAGQLAGQLAEQV